MKNKNHDMVFIFRHHKPLFENKLGKDGVGIYKVEHIHIGYSETVEITVEGKKKTKN